MAPLKKTAPADKVLRAATGRLQWIRIPEEMELHCFLEKAINARAIYDLLRRKEKLGRGDENNLQLEGVDCPLSERYGGALYRVCREVVGKLGLEGANIEFFVTQSSDVNAFAWYSHLEEKPHAITLTSGMVERFSRDAVRKVIGHELSHLLFGQSVLGEAIRSVYPNADRMPPFLKGIVDYWNQLCEMTADRMGLLAAGRLEPAIEAMFRFSTGLSLSRLDLRPKDYLRLAGRQIRRVRKNEELYSLSHPIFAMRARALSIFHESRLWKDHAEGRPLSRPDADLERRMGGILSLMKRSPLQDRARASVDFLASAGSLVMMADREVPDEEFDNLVDTISSYTFWPPARIREFLGGSRKRSAAGRMMRKSSAWIVKHAPDDRLALFDSLVNVMLRDRRVDDREVRVLEDIGTSCLELTGSEVAGRMLQGIQERFVPLRG